MKNEDPGKQDAGEYLAERAVKEIAALHDAMHALHGRTDNAAATERLALLAVQTYNQILTRAVAIDERHGSKLRFEVIQALDEHDPALNDAGLRRTGEGGLSLSTDAFARAFADRPQTGIRTVREIASACALLCAFVARARAGLGDSRSTPAPDGLDFRVVSPTSLSHATVPPPGRSPSPAPLSGASGRPAQPVSTPPPAPAAAPGPPAGPDFKVEPVARPAAPSVPAPSTARVVTWPSAGSSTTPGTRPPDASSSPMPPEVPDRPGFYA